MKILIVGVGSILRGDDGIGTRVIDELDSEDLPREVRLHSGDISGLDLLKVFPGSDRVIIIDAADMGEEPGTIKVLSLEEINTPAFKDKFSTHGIGLLDSLTLGKQLDILPEIKIVAIQPEDTSFNLEMTDLIKNTIPAIIATVKTLI